MTDTGQLRVLVWLIGAQLRNRGRSLGKRLRDPRYLAALLVGIAYFVVVFAPQVVVGDSGSHPGPTPALAAELGPLAMAAWLLYWWLRGGYQQVLAFTPAESTLLFPAPLRRTTLLHYKLLKAQSGIVVTSVFLLLFAVRGPLPWYLALVGLWLVVATLHLHQIGSSLVRLTAGRGGRYGLRRVAVPLVLMAMLVVGLGWTVASAVLAFRREAELGAALTAAGAALDGPVARVALSPFRALLAPAVAPDVAAWLRSLPLAAGLLLVHYIWVMDSQAAFEEAAAEAGRHRAKLRAAVRRGRAAWSVRKGVDLPARGRFALRPRLEPEGEPALALVWKHALELITALRPGTLAVMALAGLFLFAMVGVSSGSVSAAAAGMAVMAVTFAGATVIMGPLALRYDFRRDLEYIELLRTFPLDPVWVAAAEVASTTVLLTAVAVGFVALALALLPFAPLPPGTRVTVLLGGVLAAVVLPGLIALAVVIQNALALLFPGWVRLGPGNPGGIDSLGQNILTLFAASVVLVLMLVPVAVAAGILGLAFLPVLHHWAAVPALMAGLAALWAEVVVAVRWLGRVFARLDPVAASLLH